VNRANSIRIIGGTWRSRLVTVGNVPGLRPTPDRVRETLFNWIEVRGGSNGLACLDLFAGSGILGFEAASRGADRVTFVERHAQACAALRANAQKLAATQVEIIRGDALEFIASTERRFDLVFVDPPYRQQLAEQVMPLLKRMMQPQGLAYVEAESPLAPPAGWQVFRQGRAGQVHFHLFELTE
jgi:16S rRNA (guanine(966)-N(2))-methyltransferase RsmD